MDTAPRAAQSMTAALKGQPQTSMISHLVNVFFGYAPLALSEESRRQDGAPGERKGGGRRLGGGATARGGGENWHFLASKIQTSGFIKPNNKTCKISPLKGFENLFALN